MKNKKNLIFTILTILVLGTILNAQPRLSYNNSNLASKNMRLARVEIRKVENIIRNINRKKLFLQSQATSLSKSLDLIDEYSFGARENLIVYSKYLAKNKGKGGVNPLKKYESFADFLEKKKKIFLRQLTTIERNVEKGRIKTSSRFSPLRKKPAKINSRQNEFFKKTSFTSSYLEKDEKSVKKDIILIKSNYSILSVLDCFKLCIKKKWGKCLGCIVKLACQVVNNPNTDSNGGTNSLDSCIQNCKKLPFWKRPGCKIRCRLNN